MQERKFSEMEDLGSFCYKRTNLTDSGSVFVMKGVGNVGCSITECSETFVSEPVIKSATYLNGHIALFFLH